MQQKNPFVKSQNNGPSETFTFRAENLNQSPCVLKNLVYPGKTVFIPRAIDSGKIPESETVTEPNLSAYARFPTVDFSSSINKQSHTSIDDSHTGFNVRSMVNQKPIIYPFLYGKKELSYDLTGKTQEKINTQADMLRDKNVVVTTKKTDVTNPIKMPEVVPIRTAVKVPKSIPIKMPESIPIKMPESIPVKMPEPIPNKTHHPIPKLFKPMPLHTEPNMNKPIKKITQNEKEFLSAPLAPLAPLAPILNKSKVIEQVKIPMIITEYEPPVPHAEIPTVTLRVPIPIEVQSFEQNNNTKQNDIKKSAHIVVRMEDIKTTPIVTKAPQAVTTESVVTDTDSKSEPIATKASRDPVKVPVMALSPTADTIASIVSTEETVVDSPQTPAQNLEEQILSKTDASVEKLVIASKVSQVGYTTLSIDDINTSLKVIGDLKPGIKLKIVDEKHLAEDNGTLNFITRYNSGQGRDQIIEFLENIYVEVTRHSSNILADIRSEINVDNNLSILQGLIYKISVFLHNYETMRVVYKHDSRAYSRLGLTRDKFFMFISTFFRDVIVPKK